LIKLFISKRIAETNLNEGNNRADLAASFQHTVILHLETNLRRTFKIMGNDLKNVKHFVMSGGVARNEEIRKRISLLCEEYNLTPVFPPPEFCTDNGVMIAWCGVEKFNIGTTHGLDVDILPKWPFENRYKDPTIKER